MIKDTVIFILLVILSSNLTLAHDQFQRTVGGTVNEYAYSVVQTKDGGYAMAGQTNSFGAGVFDFYITKLDSDGMLQWTKVIGGIYDDDAYSIVQTTDGGYAITGGTYSFGAGNYDFYVVKLDSNGNLQWNKTIGGPASDYAYSIIQTTDGGYALAGYTSSFGVAGSDMLIVKLDSGGNLKWAKTVGGPYYDGATCIIQTTDGGYAVAGYYYYLGSEYYDFYIVKLDIGGGLQWTRTVGGPGQDVAWSIKQTTDGGYITAGFSDSSSGGYHDCYFVKLGPTGDIQWTRTVGGGDDDYASSIIQTPDGGYAAAGQTSSFGSALKFYIVKLNTDGAFLWSKTLIGTGNGSEAESLIRSSEGNYIVAGFNFYGGQSDFYLVKFDSSWNTCGNVSFVQSTSGIRLNSGTGGSIMTVTPSFSNPPGVINTGGTLTDVCDADGIVRQYKKLPGNYELYQNYPNPFNPVTTIKFSLLKHGYVTLKIYDIDGHLVITLLNNTPLYAGAFINQFDGTNFASGVYFYTLIIDNNIIDTKKMVLIK